MLVLIFLTVLIIGLIHWYLNGIYNFWKNKGVPHPTPIPFVGNVGSALIFRRQLGLIYKDIYNDFKDCSYVGYYKLQTPGVILRSIDLIKKITVTDFACFQDNDIVVDEKIDPLFGKDPFVLKGERWKLVRSKITAAITTGKIRQMFPLMKNISEKLIEYLEKEPAASNQEGLEGKDLFTKFAADVIATCAFGLDGQSFVDPNAIFKTNGKTIYLETLTGIWMFVFPHLAHFFKLKLITDEVRHWFISTMKQCITYREENNITRKDYLDSMIKLKATPDKDYICEDEDIMANLMIFVSAGMETTATALSCTLYEIAKNPDIQKRLQNEIDSVSAKYNGEITIEAVQEMEYLNMVMLETLRLYPPAVLISKSCTKQYTFPPARGEGTGPSFTIEPGMSVVIPIYAIHTDPQYYPNPEKFDPERFTEEAKLERPKCVFIPFGEGARSCLGFRFALAAMKIAFTSIISNYEVTVNPKTAPTFELDPKCLFIKKQGGIWLNFQKRSK